MHPHLHTKDNTECENVMMALEECHARGFMWKSMGMCNDAKEKVSACLKVARQRRLDENRLLAQAKKEERRRKIEAINKELGL